MLFVPNSTAANVLINTPAFFMTGTDTEIGKTICTVALMRYLQQCNQRVVALKPIASGCEITAEGYRNMDAQLLQKHSSLELAYTAINPYAFLPPIAPHLAAHKIGVQIDIFQLAKHISHLKQSYSVDKWLIEGVGGWRVPLNEQQSIQDLVHQLKMPVILVVGLKLGCINHALLTAETIMRDGCQLAGWIANHLKAEDFTLIIETLKQRIDAPLLGEVGYCSEII